MSRSKLEPKHAITIRLPSDLYEKVRSDAAAQDWSINDEINYRLRAKTTNQKIDKLEADVAELKAMIKSLLDK